MSNSYSVYEKPTHNCNFALLRMERRHSSFGKSDQKLTLQHSEMLHPLLVLLHQELSICNYLIPGQKPVDNEIPTECLPQGSVQTLVPHKKTFFKVFHVIFPCHFFPLWLKMSKFDYSSL